MGEIEIKPQEGLIGIFDILGYKNFVARNSVQEAAAKALKTIAALREDVTRLTFITSTQPPQEIKEILESTGVQVFFRYDFATFGDQQ